jgi:beta-ketoacyl-acyl-carrier-protein synthase II
MDERIVITGFGAMCGIGRSMAEIWENCTNGVSGLGPITLFDASGINVQVACEIKGFEPSDYISPKQVRRLDRFEQIALAAAKELLENSGLEITEENADRIGTVVSSSAGGVQSLTDGIYTIIEKGPLRVSPFSTAMYMSNGAAGMTSIAHGSRGPSFSVESACASGGDAIGVSWLLLRAGLVDAVITGSSEAAITLVSVSGLDRSGAMSRNYGDPPMAPRPFDKTRDGFVIGEGVALMTLERESFARSRGAKIYAELAGYGSTADAFHITAPLEDGSGASKAIRNALRNARVDLNDVEYINAHGTGTILNDASETRAIKNVFGSRAYELPISATKSMTGHMLGATAALEAIFTAHSIYHGVLPPTINYRVPDPECDLDYVPNEARRKNIKVATSNSFGFGGHNSVLVLKAYS